MRQQQQRVLYSLTVECIRRLRLRFLFFPHWYRVMPLGAGACRRLLRSAVVPVIRPARPIPQQIREFEIAISVFDVLRCDPRLDLGHYWPLMNVARQIGSRSEERREGKEGVRT